MQWCIKTMGRFYDPNEDTVIYYDINSGDTHLLSDFAAYVITQFQEGPLTAEELTIKVSPCLETLDFSDLEKTIQDILEELSALNILTRV
ncbi:MAG: HPr-rel-A system PqqD family peptide chaperone [Halioglobus sp.]|nr:HPr-rel-A system PqqD family peptide chaperone [Halioglobus sp.]